MSRFALLIGTLATMLATLAGPSAALAQGEPLTNRRLLADFMHYVLIDQRDASIATGRMLLDRGLTPADWVNLIEESGEAARFESVVVRAQRQGEVDAIATQIARMLHQGRLERVRNPDEITRNIEALKGLARERILASDRLRAAGEYAAPLLLQALLHPTDAELNGHARSVFISMGPQAVAPLAAAIGRLDPVGQERVADILRLVGYDTALPYLVEVRDSTKSDAVRTATTRAIQQITSGAPVGSAADLYFALAQRYYAERPELTSFPGEAVQIVWTYDPRIGLIPTAVATEVYHEMMAMRLAEHRLSKWTDDAAGTLALWVAANLKREIEQPRDYDNPMYPSTRRDAHYFAVASGSDICQRVLARAIVDRNTLLVLRAVAALQTTAGGNVLWESQSGRPPLLDALIYPNRRVRYEAALALAAAQPNMPFTSSERVVPTLASATREASQSYAIVISSDVEVYQELRRILEGMGYSVLPHGRSLAEVAGPLAETPGVDLVVSSLPSEATLQLISQVSDAPELSATPLLALVSQQGYIDLNRQFAGHERVAIRQQGIAREAIVATASDLVLRASGGPISPAEARRYQERALAALRDLAVAGSTVFDVGDAALPLIRALAEVNPALRLEVAEILSRINQKRAQVALMDAALAASGPERIALLGKVAASAKRFGNLLDSRQITRVVAMATAAEGDDAEATAAASLMGALNLPNVNLVPMILGQ